MEYVIQCDSQHDETRYHIIFLVDRNKNKKRWWSHELGEAKIFNSMKSAMEQLKKLKFNNPKIITYQEASKIAADYLEDDLNSLDYSDEALF